MSKLGKALSPIIYGRGDRPGAMMFLTAWYGPGLPVASSVNHGRRCISGRRMLGGDDGGYTVSSCEFT
jgi:hypothetical protein